MSNWSRKLSRPIQVLERGPQLVTLAAARAYILSLPDGKQDSASWQHAIELVMTAASDGTQVAAATEAIERALFLEAKWLPSK